MRWVACGIELDYFAHVGRAYSQRRPPASSHLGVGNDLKVVSGEVRQICRDEQGRLPKSATQSPQHKVRNTKSATGRPITCTSSDDVE